MIAEKSSIAKILSDALSNKKYRNESIKIKQFSECCLYTFNGLFKSTKAHFFVSAVNGHIYSTDFCKRDNDWDEVGPISLYDTFTQKKEEIYGYFISRIL